MEGRSYATLFSHDGEFYIAAKNSNSVTDAARVSQGRRGKAGGPDQIGIPTDAQVKQLTQTARVSQQNRITRINRVRAALSQSKHLISVTPRSMLIILV